MFKVLARLVLLGAAVLAVEAEKHSAQCGPSLLQVSAVRSQAQAPPDEEQADQPAPSKKPTAPKPESATPKPESATPKPESAEPKPKPWRGRLGSKKHQLLLEIGTLVALVLLLGAGLYFVCERRLGLVSRYIFRTAPAVDVDATTSTSLRIAAWGENVQNEYCDYVMVFSANSGESARLSSGHSDLNRTLLNISRSVRDPNLNLADLGSDQCHRIVNGFEWAKKVFFDSHRHHFVSESSLKERFQDGMTFQAYQNASCELLLAMFTSAQFGFTIEKFTNADKDRTFWRIDLDDAATCQYAAHYRYPVSLSDSAYEEAGVPVPTNWEGHKVHAFWPYMPKWAPMYKKMTQTDRHKLMRMRIKRYVNLDALMEQKVLKMHFAVHDVEEIGFFVRTWANVRHWYRFPAYDKIDRVKEYFGEQVGFMFLWQRFYLGALLVPAIAGALVFLRRFCLPERVHTTVQMVFTVVMSVWATIFNARYARFEERTRQRWGTSEFRAVCQDLQSGYKPELQGSWRVFFVYAIGDVLAFLFMLLSVVTTFAIQYMRSHYRTKDQWYVEKGAGVTTAVQILLLDYAWQYISYTLINLENHRLQVGWWDAWIKRMLTVRVFTNLYPFVYVGFLKEYTGQGCPRSGRGCLDELETNLMIFFGLSLACNLARDINLIFYARVQRALERVSISKEHMPLQVQATLHGYDEWLFIDDWTRQVTTFLLLTCFNVVLPVIGVFVLLTTMFEARLLAHRICCHLQRPFPQAVEGIGSWQGVLEVMTLLGVLITSSFAIFVMHPLRQRPLWEKVALFVGAEHFLLFLNLFVRTKFPKVPPDVHECLEANEKILMRHFIDPTFHGINVPPTETLGAKLRRAVGAAVTQQRAQAGVRPDILPSAVRFEVSSTGSRLSSASSSSTPLNPIDE